ncbi:MAG: hypothetical protein IT581_04500 [Verrucomicrobiales bacterium]|nr:hypothetical protein [Verrucomicrobiales bacterium]
MHACLRPIRNHLARLGAVSCAIAGAWLSAFQANAQLTEPSGDTMIDAVDLGVLEAPLRMSGRVNEGAPADFYRFEVTGVVADVSGLIPRATLQSYLQLSLVQDANSNFVVEDEEVLATDQGYTGSDAITRLWLNPGVYYLRVQAISTYNTSYELTLSKTAKPSSGGSADDTLADANQRNPILPARPVVDFVGSSDGVDYYRFEVTNLVHEARAIIPGSTMTGYLTLRLIQDVNGNQLPDDNEVLATDAGHTGEPAEVERWLNPGTYYIGVHAYPGYSTGYELTLSLAPQPQSGGQRDDTIALADTRNPLVPARAVSDFVGSSDDTDYYRFEVPDSVSEVQAVLPRSSLVGYAILTILRDANQNGVMEDDEVMAAATGHGGADARVLTWLDPGTYYLRVSAYPGYSTTYSVTLAVLPRPWSRGILDNDANSATALGHISAPRQVDDYLGNSDEADYYQFEVSGPTRKVTALLPRDFLNGYIFLKLFRDANNDSILEEMKSAVGHGGASASIEQDLGPGTYYLGVLRYPGYTTTYRLVLSREFAGNVAPFLLVPPIPQTVAAGKSATFTVQADGSGALSYQWFLNGEQIPGATASTVTLTDRIAQIGEYSVNARITSSLGTLTTDPVRLQVTPANVAIEIARAALLSWPLAGTEGYLLQGAPTPNGPWTFQTNRPVTAVGNRREVTVPNPEQVVFYRLAKP